PDLPGVDERITVIVPDQERPDPDPRPLRVREPADDEFLAAEALDLHPGGVAPTDVRAGQQLADDPLVAAAAGVAEEGLPLALAELRPPHPVRPRHCFAEEPLSLRQRLAGQVLALEPQ